MNTRWLSFGICIAVALFILAPFFKSYDVLDGVNDDISYLPIVQGGRVKPLDSVARNMALEFSGKQNRLTYQDETLSPVQWILNVMLFPEKTDTMAVFRVDHPDIKAMMSVGDDVKMVSFNTLTPIIPALEEQAVVASERDANERSLFQRDVLRLVSKIRVYMSAKNSVSIEGADTFSNRFAQFQSLASTELFKTSSLDPTTLTSDQQAELLSLLNLLRQYRYMDSVSEWRMVPGAFSDGSDWQTFGGGALEVMDGGSEDYFILLNMIFAAYESGETVPLSAASSSMRQLIADQFPDLSRRLFMEVWFNRAALFYQSTVLYVGLFLGVCIAWWRKSVRALLLNRRLLYIVFGLHSLGLLLRMIIQGRPPVTNLYSSAVFVGWVAIAIAILLEKRFKNGVGTLVSAIIGFLTLIIAHHLSLQGDTLEMMQAVLDSNFWLATHVITVNMGYGGTFVMGVVAHIFIARFLFSSSFSNNDRKSLMSMVFGAACFALLFTFVGTILGGIWADQSWGRFWGWDPKENGALLIILWLALMLHARIGGFVSERTFMAMAVFANIVTAFAWFGVNLLGVGLHSYGFTDSGLWWLILFSFVETMIAWSAFLKR